MVKDTRDNTKTVGMNKFLKARVQELVKSGNTSFTSVKDFIDYYVRKALEEIEKKQTGKKK